MGLEVLQVAFVVIGVSSILVSLVTLLLMKEPPKERTRSWLPEFLAFPEQGQWGWWRGGGPGGYFPTSHPGSELPKLRTEHSLREELKRFLSYFQLPTFCVLVLQGCFGPAQATSSVSELRSVSLQHEIRHCTLEV